MKNRAQGWLSGLVGTQAFKSTSVGFVADDQSNDFVVQAEWTADDGHQRGLTLYLPEREPERKKYTYGSGDEYQASAYYVIAGKPESWQAGYVVRERADFSSGDPVNWRVMLSFSIEVAMGEGVVSISGQGEVTGAAPWGKALRKRFAFH